MKCLEVDFRLVMRCRVVCCVWLEKYVSCGIDRAWESTSHWAMESCEVQIVLTEKEGKPNGKSNLVEDLLNNIGEMG